jgi:transglutaminase-like putative cysteine protease
VAGLILAAGTLVLSVAIGHEALAVTQPEAAAQVAAQVKERWYTVSLAGSPSGYMSTIVTTEQVPGGEPDASGTRITTDTSLTITIARGPVKLNVVQESRFVETGDGKPVMMRSRQDMGAEIVQEYVFSDGEIELTTRQAGSEPKVSKVKPPDGAWLTPAAAEAYVRQRAAAGANETTVRTMDPSLGVTIITAERTIGARKKIEIDGRAIDVTEHTVSMSNMPGMKSVELVDEAGDIVQSTTQIGGIPIVMTASTKAKALKGVGGAEVPEIMLSTFVRPDKPIDRARDTVRASYIVRVKEGEAIELPSSGGQRVEKVDAKTVRVTVDTASIAEAPRSEVDDEAFLGSSAMIDATNPKVVELAKGALSKSGASGKSQAEIAEALRRFAHSYIKKKNLGVGFASATEVARSREGDCTEHGVFLAALLRSQGIPARVVSGLIYADSFAGSQDIFGYHMWTQALLEIDGAKRWVDLDATLPAKYPRDATHIAAAVTALGDGEMGASMMPVAQMMGRVEILVERVEHAPGAPVTPVTPGKSK